MRQSHIRVAAETSGGNGRGRHGATGPQIAFDIYLGIIVLVSMVGYMGVTIWITEWRTRFRRESNDADNDARQKGGWCARHGDGCEPQVLVKAADLAAHASCFFFFSPVFACLVRCGRRSRGFAAQL